MGDEKNLRESLISVFEQLKSQDGKIAEMICDVAALRTVLLENSLETQKRYEQVFDEEVQQATSAMVSATRVYDDLIQALKSGTFWIN